MCCSSCYQIVVKGVRFCFRECKGKACPFDDIDEKVEEISKIQGKIEKVVNDEDEKNMGIIPIIDKIVPKLLEDLDKLVRKPTKECITDVPVESAVESTEIQVILSDCESSVRTVGPDGVVIQKCCLEESEFQNCLQQCYAKSGQDYEKCLNDCLKGTNNGEISICNHRINFYCCGM